MLPASRYWSDYGWAHRPADRLNVLLTIGIPFESAATAAETVMRASLVRHERFEAAALIGAAAHQANRYARASFTGPDEQSDRHRHDGAQKRHYTSV